ncbi:MAG: tyrosine recombinase XerC [Bacteroidota bacterium]
MSDFSPLTRFTRYLEIERNASPKTVEAYRRDISQFLTFCSREWDLEGQQLDYDRIDRLMIRLWLGSLIKNKAAKSTISRKTASVRSFLKFAFKRGIIQQNPAHLLMTPKKQHRLPKTVRPEELSLMMETIEADQPAGKRDLALMELLYSTGIRLSELTGLNIRDMDLARKRIRVLGKGSRERIVPFGDLAHGALTEYLNERTMLTGKKTGSDDQRALFLTDSGKRIYPRFVQRKVAHYLARVSEISQKSPHILRHSFATHLLDRGAGIRVIKELLGHADLAATQIYTGTSVEHLRNIYRTAHPRSGKTGDE